MAPYCSNMKKPPDSLIEKMIQLPIFNQRQTRFDNSIRARSPVINTAAISPTVTQLMLPRCQRSGISRNASAESVGLQKATAKVSSSRRTRSRSDSRMVQFTGNNLRLLCVQPSTSYSNTTEEIRRPRLSPMGSHPALRNARDPGITRALTCGQYNIALE